ncbi:alkaline phosphatase [Pleurocapsa sp. PCC 7319]|uniref:alkaline phosphatase D family protein n=1 Tax=Pleurocapsa sp. PCC 7319 TaxID=118161 RepID=UPI000347F399|nr:alkaline phosphatase D family protein [Pleurocapsa sp. PCC 7319]
MTNKNKIQTVVKFDDTFYLKNKSGQYLIAADNGRYFFPQLDRSGQTKLQLKGKTGELQHNDNIKIRSLETQLGDRNILGAFSDSRNCYYWDDGYDEDKQNWKITNASGERGKIRYGDEVYLTNVHYDNQTLAIDPKNPGYLTTVKNAKEVWILETTQKQSPTVVSSTPKSSVFGLSVASGDPTPTGVILWTRINPEACDGNITLKYEVSRQREFKETDIVISEDIPNSKFGKETDYTVKVDLDTKLEPDRTYFYRFIYGEATSPIGRCKTLPRENERIEKLRLAVITCNDYSTGYFNAFYHLAEEDVDFVVHLGDFVYEYSQYPPNYGEVYRKDIYWEEDDYGQSSSETQRATSLENFQQIYRTYRQDLALQAAMEQHTWMITLDDHEVADNWYWDREAETISVDGHPVAEKTKDESLEKKRKARAKLYNSAIKAWMNYVPARLQKADTKEVESSNTQEPEILEGLELHKNLIYRRFRFGSLVDFFLTDSRSFRSKPDLDSDNPNPQATMLGKNQKKWLIEGVKNSNAAWKVWGNQTLLATAWFNAWYKPDLIDDWQAYMGERREILQAVKDSETKKHNTNKASRFVVFTGDMHTSMISYLKTDFEGKRNKINMDYSKLAGVEFMTPALTSPGVSEGARSEIDKFVSTVAGATEITSDIAKIAEKLPNLPFFSNDSSDDAGEGSKLHKASIAELTKRFSPHIEHYDSSINGYAIAEFTPSEMRWEVFAINKSDYDVADDGRNISKRGARKHLAKSMKYYPDTITLDD